MSLDFLEVPGSHTRKYSFKSDVWQAFCEILLPAGHCPGPQRPATRRLRPPVGHTFEDLPFFGQFPAGAPRHGKTIFGLEAKVAVFCNFSPEPSEARLFAVAWR